MTKNVDHLSEQDKQIKPMAGEVDPKDAWRMAMIFAAKEKDRISTIDRALQRKTEDRK